MSSGREVVIVGAGISGLKAALMLLESDLKLRSLTLIDNSKEVGGVLRTVKTESGYVFELGAQGILSSREHFIKEVEKLGIANQVIFSTKQKRFLLFHEKKISVSWNLFSLLGSGVLSFFSLFKMICDFFSSAPKCHPNVTLYDFFEAKFGRRVADTLVVPMTYGIWGGGSRKLLLRLVFPRIFQVALTQGSVLRSLIFDKKVQKISAEKKGFLSFNDGMQTLPRTMLKKMEEVADAKDVLFHFYNETLVTDIKSTQGKFLLSCDSGWKFSADTLLFNGKPWKKTIDIFKGISWKIQTHSLALVGLGGKCQPGVSYLNGFGILNHKWDSSWVLGVITVHSTFPEHVPKGHFLYRILLGGEKKSDISEKNKEEIIAQAKDFLAKNHMVSETQIYDFENFSTYPNYIPLQTDTFEEFQKQLWLLEAQNPGLYFVGNYKNGPSVEDCLKAGEEVAHNIVEENRNQRA